MTSNVCTDGDSVIFIVSFYKDSNQLIFWGYDSVSRAMDDVASTDIGVWKIKKLK